jgi:hypothetical protein
MRQRLRLLLVVAVAAVAAATVAPAGARADTSDVVGTWTASIATTGGDTHIETWRIQGQSHGQLDGVATGGRLLGLIEERAITVISPSALAAMTTYEGTFGDDGRMTGTFTDPSGAVAGTWAAVRVRPKLIVEGRLTVVRGRPGRIPVGILGDLPRTFQRFPSTARGAYRIEVELVASLFLIGPDGGGWCLVGRRRCADTVYIDAAAVPGDIHRTVNFESMRRHAQRWGARSIAGRPDEAPAPRG